MYVSARGFGRDWVGRRRAEKRAAGGRSGDGGEGAFGMWLSTVFPIHINTPPFKSLGPSPFRPSPPLFPLAVKKAKKQSTNPYDLSPSGDDDTERRRRQHCLKDDNKNGSSNRKLLKGTRKKKQIFKEETCRMGVWLGYGLRWVCVLHSFLPWLTWLRLRGSRGPAAPRGGAHLRLNSIDNFL